MTTSQKLPPALQAHLANMTTPALKRMLRDSRKALAEAEPHEHIDRRARVVADANRKMIPVLETFIAER